MVATIGLDIGGTKVLGVLLGDDGTVLREERLASPHTGLDALVATGASIVEQLEVPGAPVGVGAAGLVDRDGNLAYAPNLPNVRRAPLRDALAHATGRAVTVDNDASVATRGEVTYGAAMGKRDVLLVTLGTGIGSALFTEGTLVPNTELGHIEIRGKDAEERASAHAREVQEWSWHKWAEKLDEYLQRVEDLVWPSLIIVGGGVSRHAEHFLPHLKDVRATVVAAELHNAAGIVGAAMAAAPRTQTG
jgi:polyphosphate glucokinase